MRPRVAVVHHQRSYFPSDLSEAVRDTVDLIWVLVDETVALPRPNRLLPRLGDVVEIRSDDLDEAASLLAEQGPDGIVTFVDDHLVLTSELAARLGLPAHTPEVAARVVNKRRQRETLAAAGVPGPAFWSLPPWLDRDELAELAAVVRYPAVLKPAYGSGSRGIVRVDSPAELLAAHAPDHDELVEVLMTDDPTVDRRFASYLSVESVISAAGVSHVALTGRFPLAENFRETGNFVPASVSDEVEHALLEIADAAIAALEIRSGVIHTEIKLTPDGPRLVEVNGRLGGRPPFVLRSISDVNLFETACLVAAGRPISYDGQVQCSEIGYWRMLQPPLDATGVVEITGVEALGRLDQVDSIAVRRGAGQAIDSALGTDSCIAVVRGRVSSFDELAATVQLIDRSVDIRYEQTEDRPAVPTAAIVNVQKGE